MNPADFRLEMRSRPWADDSVHRAGYPFEGYDPDTTHLQWDRALIVGAGLAGLITGIHIYQANAWWQDQRTSFHFVNDNTYALDVDKAGHFFGGAISTFIARKSLEWSGFSRSRSLWYGVLIGSLFELYIEFEDGFAKDWGFSPGDAAGDLLGVAWPVAQEYIPGMRHFQPKFSYYPSPAFLDGTHPGNGFDDYNGQTYWMSVHLEGLLPESLQPYWPDWLALAAGVSVRGVAWGGKPERHILLALDYDVTKIIPGDGWFITALKEGLNHIHLPAPAIQISPNFIGYGLYFR